MSISKKIHFSIANMPKGAVFSSADFLTIGSRSSIDQTLYRMVNACEIIRVARGLYTLVNEIDTNAVVLAVEKKLVSRLAKYCLTHRLPLL